MLIIGIAGGTGSGKTTVVRKILNQLPTNEVTLLSQDSYYHDNSHLTRDEKKRINFDHPNAIDFELLAQHISELKSGHTIPEPIYSYVTCERSTETRTVTAKKVLVVEGILVLSQQILRDSLDIKVFVDADADDRLIRVLERDLIERGRGINDILLRYQDTVKPMHNQFIEPSKAYADVIIPQGGHNKVAINVLAAVIENRIRQDQKTHE